MLDTALLFQCFQHLMQKRLIVHPSKKDNEARSHVLKFSVLQRRGLVLKVFEQRHYFFSRVLDTIQALPSPVTFVSGAGNCLSRASIRSRRALPSLISIVT